MQELVDICHAPYSMQNEDTANYGVGWTQLVEPTDNSTPVCPTCCFNVTGSVVARLVLQESRAIAGTTCLMLAVFSMNSAAFCVIRS